MAAGASGTVSFQVTVGSGAGGATQTAPTLSTEPGTGSVTVVSKTSQYSSLPWCDSVYNVKCLTYRGLYNAFDSTAPVGWNENPRGGAAFDDSTWAQPFAATIEIPLAAAVDARPERRVDFAQGGGRDTRPTTASSGRPSACR